MITLQRPEGWDKYIKSHFPVVMASGVLWIPRESDMVFISREPSADLDRFVSELTDLMSTPLEEKD